MSDTRDTFDIEFRHVVKRYGAVTAVNGLDFKVRRGAFHSFLGSSGCGKTTTLRMIAGFEQPSEGEVLLAGRSVAGVPAHQRPVNMVFQSYALFPHLSVLDNIAYGLRYLQPRPDKAMQLMILLFSSANTTKAAEDRRSVSAFCARAPSRMTML